MASIQGSMSPICIGKRITQVQQTFGDENGVPANELQIAFDSLLNDENEVFQTGYPQAKVIHLPGYTPDHVGYTIRGEGAQWLLAGRLDR
jgi:glyoxylase-like metal-dependent hydrolase (beta-lactamase superfamily II)